MTYSAITIANYIINKCTEDQQPISNLQLQKILYYVQRDSLRQGTPAFDDIIEAIYTRIKIEKGLNAVKEEKGLSTEELLEEMKAW